MLAPCTVTEAHRQIRRLRLFPLLAGARGTPPVDLDALADALVRFSGLAAALSDRIGSMDVNPLVASAAGVVALDALVVSAIPVDDPRPLASAAG